MLFWGGLSHIPQELVSGCGWCAGGRGVPAQSWGSVGDLRLAPVSADLRHFWLLPGLQVDGEGERGGVGECRRAGGLSGGSRLQALQSSPDSTGFTSPRLAGGGGRNPPYSVVQSVEQELHSAPPGSPQAAPGPRPEPLLSSSDCLPLSPEPAKFQQDNPPGPAVPGTAAAGAGAWLPREPAFC